ncbi:MAG: hypothetical protein R2755_12365 [Acidimicrobiales bacterium]
MELACRARPPASRCGRGLGRRVCLRSAVLGRTEPVTQPGGGTAVTVDGDGVQVRVVVDAAADEVVVRSYCTGGAHGPVVGDQ